MSHPLQCDAADSMGRSSRACRKSLTIPVVLLRVAEIRRGETVYSAATRICHSQEELGQQQQGGCVIPLAKWLGQVSRSQSGP